MIMLGRYFSLDELTITSSGLPNDPPMSAVANLTRLVRTRLDPARTREGRPMRVTSGYRSDEVNVYAGGSPTSAHKDGRAADVKVDGRTSVQLARTFILDPGFDQVIAYHPSRGGQVHVGIAPDGCQPRGQILIAPPGGGYPPWDGVSDPW